MENQLGKQIFKGKVADYAKGSAELNYISLVEAAIILEEIALLLREHKD